MHLSLHALFVQVLSAKDRSAIGLHRRPEQHEQTQDKVLPAVDPDDGRAVVLAMKRPVLVAALLPKKN